MSAQLPRRIWFVLGFRSPFRVTQQFMRCIRGCWRAGCCGLIVSCLGDATDSFCCFAVHTLGTLSCIGSRLLVSSLSLGCLGTAEVLFVLPRQVLRRYWIIISVTAGAYPAREGSFSLLLLMAELLVCCGALPGPLSARALA